MRRWLVPSVTCLVLGCGSSVPLEETPSVDLECHGRLDCLPEGAHVESRRSRRMRRGWLLARNALHMPPPPRPEELDSLDLDEYWQNLDEWLDERNDRLEAARFELDEAASEDPRQLIVSTAVLGLVYEDVVQELRALPVPERIGQQTVDEATYIATLGAHARPYLQRAEAAYRECAHHATTPRDMHTYRYFCAARREQLTATPPPPEAPSPGTRTSEGDTTVEVVRR